MTQTIAKAALLAAEPQLFTAHIAAACAFYRKLGFAIAFVWGDPPFYAQIVRDGVRVNLRHVDEPPFHAAPERDQLLAATVTVDGVESLFAEFKAAGAVFAQTLQTEEWGAQTFILRDPDGNLVLFAGSARDRDAG